MFLSGDQTLVRGDDARRYQLPDMFVHEISRSFAGPSTLFAMGLLIGNGKMNKVSSNCAELTRRGGRSPSTAFC